MMFKPDGEWNLMETTVINKHQTNWEAPIKRLERQRWKKTTFRGFTRNWNIPLELLCLGNVETTNSLLIESGQPRNNPQDWRCCQRYCFHEFNWSWENIEITVCLDYIYYIYRCVSKYFGMYGTLFSYSNPLGWVSILRLYHFNINPIFPTQIHFQQQQSFHPPFWAATKWNPGSLRMRSLQWFIELDGVSSPTFSHNKEFESISKIQSFRRRSPWIKDETRFFGNFKDLMFVLGVKVIANL